MMFLAIPLLIVVLFFSTFLPSAVHAVDLKPVGRITAFGGAERVPDNSASGIGGVDGLGLVPVGKNVGLQGGLFLSGGQGFKVGVNAGPVLNFDSGKLGLFVDYEHRAREDFNYVGIRGIGGYYFNRFDALLSYSQPVSSVHRFDNRKIAGINELHGVLRFYPTNEIEINGGFLVNSFAGPDRHDNGGTGVGGSFGASFKLFDPIVIQLVQAKIDNRERYRVTSGIEIIWGSPLQEFLREHLSLPSSIGGAGSSKSSKTNPPQPPPPPTSGGPIP
jgi:hypothetical protein